MKANLFTATAAVGAVLLGCVVPLSAIAVSEPQPSLEDPRIGVVMYSPNDVTRIRVRRGTFTKIVLEPGERVESANPGLTSRCDKDEDEWCIHADRGANEIGVRPKDLAKTNNLEVHSDRRNYSIEFVVLPDETGAVAPAALHGAKAGHQAATQPFFRVSFAYPAPESVGSDRDRVVAAVLDSLDGKLEAGSAAPTPAADSGLAARERLADEPAQIRNAHYTMQVLEHGEDAAPSLVFDDGRFTYFEFRGAREIPAVFANDSAGQAMRVNWHMQGSYVVVERTARSFVLRLGDAVTGVFNEKFDPEGIETPTNTTSALVSREARDERKDKSK